MTLAASADVPKAVSLVMLGILFLWFGRLTQLPLRGGPSRIVALELAPTVQAANRLLDAWKAARPKRWRDDLNEAQGWDTWFICAYAPLFTLLCWLAADHFTTAHPRWTVLGHMLAGAQLFAGGLDFVTTRDRGAPSLCTNLLSALELNMSISPPPRPSVRGEQVSIYSWVWWDDRRMHVIVALVRENQRDIGLVRAVGSWAFAASIVSMIVGAGIFAVPAALAACVGPYAPLAFLACGFAVGAVAICFAEGGSRVPTSGGVYGVIEAAFGPLAGYVSGTLLWVCCVLACGAVAAALADVAATLFPQSLIGPVRGAVIVGVIGGIALINIGGVARGARLVSATTTLKLAPLAIFILAGASAIHSSNFVLTVQPDARGFGRALILAVFALVGMETSLCASGEVVQPNRTIPRALAIAMLSTTILYVAIQVIAQGVLGSSLATSKAPLADAMAQIHPALRAVMLAGTALSMFGWLGSDILGSPRQLFAFARDGLLPRVLGQLHPRSHAPYVAILCYSTIAIVLALTGTFAELVVLSTLAIAALYIAGCAASWVLARRGVALSGTPLNFRFLGAATVIGIISMLALIALGSHQELIGLATLIGLSILLYLIQARIALAKPH